MKLQLSFALAAISSWIFSAHGQILTVAVTGTVTADYGPLNFPGVAVGTAYTETLSVDESSLTADSIVAGGRERYSNDGNDTSDTLTFSAANYSYSATLGEIDVYYFSSSDSKVLFLGGNNEVELLTNVTFPDGTLSNLINTPPSGYDLVDSVTVQDAPDGSFGPGALDGSVVGLSVTEAASAAPEPSTWALLLGGLGLLVFWSRRKLKE